MFCKKIIISHLAPANSDITLNEHKTGDGGKCEDYFANSSPVVFFTCSCTQAPLLCVIFGLGPGLFMNCNSITYSLTSPSTIYTHFLYCERWTYTSKNVTSLFCNINESGNTKASFLTF